MPKPLPGQGSSHNADGQGRGYDPAWRSAPMMVVELRGKDQSMRLDEISRLHIFFGPRSIFGLVRSGQRSNFRENDIFWLYTPIAA